MAILATLFLLALAGATVAAGEEVNLLPNGGFEKDENGVGIADGWVAQPSHFSRQTLDEVQSYIENLPPWEQLLEGKTIPAADGTPIWTRKADDSWPAKMFTFGSQYWGAYERHWRPEVNWYERVKREAIPRYSRFGELPVPDDLDLGAVTLMLSLAFVVDDAGKPILVSVDIAGEDVKLRTWRAEVSNVQLLLLDAVLHRVQRVVLARRLQGAVLVGLRGLEIGTLEEERLLAHQGRWYRAAISDLGFV